MKSIIKDHKHTVTEPFPGIQCCYPTLCTPKGQLYDWYENGEYIKTIHADTYSENFDEFTAWYKNRGTKTDTYAK